MNRKLMTCCLALSALIAVVFPAGAGATTVTHPTGTTLAAGNKILGTQIGSLILWNTPHTIKLVDCSTGTITGTLTANDPTPQATITSAVFGGTGPLESEAFEHECTGELGGITIDTNIGNGVPWCLTLTSTSSFSLRGNECPKEVRSITLVITSTTAGTCKYNRTAAVTGTAKNDLAPNNSDAILSITAGANSEWTKHEGGVLCPSAFQLEVSFTLETDTGATAPIYLS